MNLVTSIQNPMNRLFGFLLLAITGAYLVFAVSNWQEVHVDAENETRYVTDLIHQATQSTLIKHESTLKVVGQELIDTGALNEPEKGRSIVQKLIDIDDGMAGFGLARKDGQLVLVSNVKAGTDLPNLAATPQIKKEFDKALKDGQMRIGRPYFMQQLQQWVVPIRVPVSGSKTKMGEVGAMMTAGYKLINSHVGWEGDSLPDGAEVSIIRNDGFYQFHYPLKKENYRAFYSLPVPDVLKAEIIHSDQSIGLFYAPNNAGQSTLYQFQKVTDYELTAITTFPVAKIHTDFLKRMLMPTIMYLAVLIVGFIAFRRIKQAQSAYENELIHQATHDSLTGLPNRKFLKEYLDSQIKATDYPSKRIAILFMDLDFFKKINDSFGHTVGDNLLKAVSVRLEKILEGSDIVCRQGGDEFILVTERCHSLESIKQVAEKIQNILSLPFLIEHKNLNVGTSIGISIFPDDAKTTEVLLKNADTALYKVKEEGRAAYAFYSDELNAHVLRRLTIEESLTKAIDNQQISVVYQPQADVQTDRIIGVEALIRWHSEELGSVGPDEFIPIAEDTGIVKALDSFVMHTAIATIKDISEQLGTKIHLSINVSTKQLLDDTFPRRLKETLEQYQFCATCLNVELTETSVLSDYDTARSQLQAIRSLGVGVSIDDFGTGFSSLTYLHKLPATEIKIDKSFVRDILVDEYDAALTKSVIQMGKGLKLKVVAEGVETEAHLQKLKSYQCDLIQGYYLSRPISSAELIAVIEKNNTSACID